MKRSTVFAGAAHLIAILSGATSCGSPEGTAPVEREAQVGVKQIIDGCVAAHQHARSLVATGILRDYRGPARRVVPIRWDIAGVDRCRLQIDMDVAWVMGRDWWTYDHASNKYRKHDPYTRNLMQTASFLLSDQIEFLLPAILVEGRRAFGIIRDDDYSEWTLQGVGWQAERPCYVLTRLGRGRTRGMIHRVWIDQDSFLLRGWTIDARGKGPREQTVLGCTYYGLRLDGPIGPDRFALNPPQLVRMPETDTAP